MGLAPIDDIKARLDIADVIQGYIRLQKAGINYKANCPFHTEKTPSFFVSPVRQIWHCFGCAKGGDVFKFVMEIEGHDFPEALRLLAARAGVVLKREDPAVRSERNRLYDICEEASRVFERNLALTPAVKSYLQKRGVGANTIQIFRIGFAPQSWDFLIKALAQHGFKKEEVERAGLAIKSENGASWYDRFRSRIMFPISDSNGRIVGFSGRTFEQEASRLGRASLVAGSKKSASAPVEAKYVNTPATLIYDKSRVLYGFDKAKEAIRSQNQVVVVEGQMDCVMSHQAGVKNTIAVSGTALTPQQLKVLRRLCDTVVSSFDTDAAGDSATKRSLALAAQFEFERRVAVIPLGKDPADTVLENPAQWVGAVTQAKPVIEFYFEKMFRENDPQGVAGKKNISAALLPLIAELPNEIEKAHWVSELAQRIAVREDAIWNELKRRGGSVSAGSPAEESAARPQSTRRELLEERMLTLLTLVREEVRRRELEHHHLIFSSSLNAELFGILRDGLPAVKIVPALEEHLKLFRFKGEILSQMTKDLEEEFVSCKHELEKEGIKERLLQIGAEIERREKEGNQTVVSALLQDFHTLSEKLKLISS